MQTTLILLNDGRNILISDEKIKENFCFDADNNIVVPIQGDEALRIVNLKNAGYKKIIAGIDTLPTLTYSDEVKQDLKEKYGYISYSEMESIAKEDLGIEGDLDNSDPKWKEVHCYIDGMTTMQSITNKIFSLENMKNALSQMCNDINNGYIRELDVDFQQADKIIQSLQQPIQLDVEIELDHDIRNTKSLYPQPKITNNSITITKILN